MTHRTRALLQIFSSALLAIALLATTAGAQSRDSKSSDMRISQEVHHQLALLPNYTVFDNLEYKIDGDKVTLLGEVTQPVLKDYAGGAVKSIEGVSQVDNQIKVLPLSPNDDQIRRAEYRSIYGFDTLSRYSMAAVPSIHIIVENGHVTLEGVVANEADRDTAEIRAKSVPGVFSVTNNLRLDKKAG